MKSLVRIILLLVLASTSRFTTAANLLANPGFSATQGLSGWSLAQDDEVQAACSGASACGLFSFTLAEDCCGDADSGAVAAVSSFFYTMSLAQCVAGVVPGSAYDFGTWMRVTQPPGAEPGLPLVGVYWFASDDCTGRAFASTASGWTESIAWTRTAVSGVVAPAGARAALFRLAAGPTGDAGTSVGMRFDGAFFGPAGTVPVELEAFEVD